MHNVTIVTTTTVGRGGERNERKMASQGNVVLVHSEATKDYPARVKITAESS